MRLKDDVRRRGALALAALALVASGCSSAGAASDPSPTPIALPTELPDSLSFEQALPLFEFDRSAPFDVQVVSTVQLDGASFSEVLYTGTSRLRMAAYLVTPAGEGPFAGVVWMGWGGDWDGIRDEFVSEAVALAERGVASLLVSGYFPWYESPSDKDADRIGIIIQVRELRRAVDLLEQRNGVDPGRIAFVGHGTGAMYGAVLTAVDRRVKVAALLTPNSTIADVTFQGYGLDPLTEQAYRAAMTPFDPLAVVPRAAPAALFFQFARDDPFVSPEAAAALFEAASEPKRLGWYGGGHDLDGQARLERDAWLEQQLGLSTN